MALDGGAGAPQAASCRSHRLVTPAVALLDTSRPTLTSADPQSTSQPLSATTDQPLAGVSVRSLESGAAATRTDERGRFTLAAQPRVLDVSHLGYAPLLPKRGRVVAGDLPVRRLPFQFIFV